MQGLSPRPYSLTLQQTQTSKKISDAIPDMPLTVSDLISEMAAPDYSQASQTLDLDQDGVVIQNARNLTITSYIELALTAPSTECDPAIKSDIFLKANGFAHNFLAPGRRQTYLARIVNGLSARHLQINLDDVVIKNGVISPLDWTGLSGMSAKRARFENVYMDRLNLSKTDFTGATFLNVSMIRTNLSKVDFVDASFIGVQFGDTLACELRGNQKGIFRRAQMRTVEQLLTDGRIESTYLCGDGSWITASPDRTRFTLPAHMTKYPMSVSTDSV